MFFDMEGNPWEDGGLEYLFGVYYRESDDWQFKGFWAHDRQQECKAFENFIDFVMARLQRFNGAHVYHYAKYEETALKKLMSLHATREVQVDNLLRHGILVDLYQVVREAIRVSEPRYSIKNIEHFYMTERDTQVLGGGDATVAFEEYLDGDPSQMRATRRTGDLGFNAGRNQVESGKSLGKSLNLREALQSTVLDTYHPSPIILARPFPRPSRPSPAGACGGLDRRGRAHIRRWRVGAEGNVDHVSPRGMKVR